MGLFSKIKEGLRKTKESMISGMQRVVNSFTKIDEDLFEQLEETMIMSDMGVETSVEICEKLRKRVKERGVTDPGKIMELIQEIISEMMGEDVALDLSTTPSIILVIVVDSPDTELFEQAIFIVRNDAMNRNGVTAQRLVDEACRVARTCGRTATCSKRSFF